MTRRSELEERLAMVRRQLSTARLLLAQFDQQLRTFASLNREGRRTAEGREMQARLPGLRDGQAKWRTRVAEAEAAVAELVEALEVAE